MFRAVNEDSNKQVLFRWEDVVYIWGTNLIGDPYVGPELHIGLRGSPAELKIGNKRIIAAVMEFVVKNSTIIEPPAPQKSDWPQKAYNFNGEQWTVWEPPAGHWPAPVSMLDIDQLNIPIRLFNLLRRHGLYTIKQITYCDDETILKLRGFGPGYLTQLRQAVWKWEEEHNK
jgi:hypothetical protein